MAGRHHRLDGRESEWTPGVGDGQEGLACCDSWGRKESDTTEWLNWTELIHTIRSPGGGHGSPLQCSCLENPVDRGAWQSIGLQRVGHSSSNYACMQIHTIYKYTIIAQPGGGNSSSPQWFCLENPMDRGARWATVHGVEKSWTWLSTWWNSMKEREEMKVYWAQGFIFYWN